MAKLAAFVIELSEAEFQSQVTHLAETLGWDWMHVVTTGKGRHFPIRGTITAGWPDLVLIKGHRIIYAELKRQNQALDPMQRQVMEKIARTGAECYVWRPSGFAELTELLSGG